MVDLFIVLVVSNEVSSSKVVVAVVADWPVVNTFGGLVVDNGVCDVVNSFSVTVSVVVTSPVV